MLPTPTRPTIIFVNDLMGDNANGAYTLRSTGVAHAPWSVLAGPASHNTLQHVYTTTTKNPLQAQQGMQPCQAWLGSYRMM